MQKSEKWLIVTEKPSVANDIAKALGNFTKNSDHYDGSDFLITWAVGHLVELLSPEEIDPKYKRWLLQDLPIIPQKFEYKPKEGQKERLEGIKSLAKRANVGGFVNACDAGREGELIFREVYDYCGVQKPMKRLWLQSMTLDSIRTEFKGLKKGSDFDALGDAARCRAESDWLIGMNATRALTKRLKSKSQQGSAWSVGRVQTPTLTLLVKRELDHLKHRPEPYWTVEGRFSTPTHEYSGNWFDPHFKKSASAEEEDSAAVREKEDRIFDQDRVGKIEADVKAHAAQASATETRKESKETPPQMFDLTMLQREANRRFGMSASRTLQAAQRLYEKHKALTYPRTDSKYLPEDYEQTCVDVIKRVGPAEPGLAKFAAGILKTGLLNKARVFNNKMISDHFAIIPTGEFPKLEGDDARIFDLVLKRFLAAFMTPAIWAKVERITKVGSQNFRTRVQDLQEQGWRGVYGLDSEEESSLPKLDPKDATGDKAVGVGFLGVEPQTNATKPPPRFSEARLLSLMENAGKSVEDESIAEALKERGIGTPATRADIIENLIAKEYVNRAGKALRPTSKGIRLVDVLFRIPVSTLSSVELTGEMESDLKKMEKGAAKRSTFMQNMINFTTDVVEKARTFDFDEIYRKDPPLGPCPRCKQREVVESFWAYKCQGGKDVCDFIIWKDKNQRYIDRSVAQEVLHGAVAGPFEFFTSGGTPFESCLKVVPEKGLVLCDASGTPTESTSATESVLYEERLETTFLNLPGRLYETESAFHFEFLTPAAEAAAAAVAAAQAAASGVAPAPAVAVKGAKKGKAGAKAAAGDAAPAAPKKPAKAKGPARLSARMPKNLCSHPVTLEEFRRYVVEGATPAITDFKSKRGRPFAARLQMKPNGSFEFKFESRKKQEAPADGAEAKPAAPKKKAASSKAKIVKKAASTDGSAPAS